ncbi:MAG: hypothetical protein ACRDHL_07985 [Candidatus Promineifilaceae bacterium]
MLTPAGKECRFYYQDFHRGHSTQECRLIAASSDSVPWRPKDCFHCPVPDILQANSNPNLVLEGAVRPGILGIGRRVEVTAFCSKHLIDVENPEVGCPRCALERPGLRQLFDPSA